MSITPAGSVRAGLELGVEALELGASRQLAVEQQVARLLERRARGEIMDRITAVQELAGAPSMKQTRERSK
jgi:hypothetical protein